MRAAVLRGADIAIEELPDPVPGPGQLLLAPIATGICGSDLHAVAARRALPDPTAAPPIVMGHEFCAEVVAAGPDTDGAPPPGTRVVAIPFAASEAGPVTIGLSPDRTGGLATLVTMEAASLLPVPDAVPSDHAALTEPIAVGLHAANLATRNPEAPAVVIGCGPIGLAVILALRAQRTGAGNRGPIIAADLSAPRRAAAEALGADLVLDPATASPFDALEGFGFTEAPISPLLDESADAGGHPPGITVFECVGAPGLINDLMTRAPRHTHLVVVGVCPGVDNITPLLGITKELTVEFSFAYRPSEVAAALTLIEQHPTLITHLITARLPLDETAAAFAQLATNPQQIKILIEPQR
jgi:threonine dehydrogenase-like Zn-dependent dehydrogenase